MKKQVVYLAGGFHNDWRQRFLGWDNVEIIDPKIKEYNFNLVSHKKMKWYEYACWDLHYIKQCDICFVYMDKDNPSGYGLSVEIGYAKGLGKTVILVLEDGHEKQKYLLFLMGVADVVYNNMDDAILYLKSFL